MNPPPFTLQDNLIRLVSILHYAAGGMSLFASVFYCGITASTNTEQLQRGGVWAVWLWGLVIALTLVALLSIFLFLSGDFIRLRVYRRASISASILMLAAFPLGTLAGIFSLWALMSPLTKTLYEPARAPHVSPILRSTPRRPSRS